MRLRKLLLTAFVLSGMAALIYEIVWIRPLQFILGSTVYTISIIFAAFMVGLALGSFIISKYVDKIENLPRAYGLMELGIGLYGVLLLILFNLIPGAYRLIFTFHNNFYLFEFSKFLFSFLVLIIPTTLMGATFPIIAKFYVRDKIGKGIGEVYFANNLGAIIGSFAAGFILIPLIGIKGSIIFAGLANIVVASIVLFRTSGRLARKVIPVAVILFLLIASFSSYNIKELYVDGFNRAAFPVDQVSDVDFLFYKEGLHSTVIVTEEQGIRALLINGYGQGSIFLEDIRINFLLSYIPILLNPSSENALIIGLGTGTTSGQLNKFVDTTTVEIEPVIIEASEYFWFANDNISTNLKHNMVIDDARNYLLRNDNKYDIIISEPTNTWQSFSTALFSKEFFGLVAEDLNSDGLYLQWVPIYDFTEDDFKSLYRTFNSEFPYVLAFVNVREDDVGLPPSELILVGSKSPIDQESIRRNFEILPDFSLSFLEVIQIRSAEDILHLVIFEEKDLVGYADDAELVTDDNALLEFSTGARTLSTEPVVVINSLENYIGSSGQQTGLKVRVN